MPDPEPGQESPQVLHSHGVRARVGERLSKGASLLKKIALQFLLVIVGIVVFKPIEAWWSGPSQYKVYLVGRTANQEIKKMFRTIQDDSALALLKIDGKDIVVGEVNDDGSAGKAQEIAKRLADLPDTLMVIGHVMTQSTMDALPSYMAADPKVPVIATRETHPDLLKRVVSPKCEDKDVYCPFMPMSPTDTDQAQIAIGFAISANHSHRFLIVKDNLPRNQDYADNLIAAYTNEIEDRHSELVTHVDVVDEVSRSAAALQISQRMPDCVLYIGPEEHAQMFLDTLRPLLVGQQRQPLIVLSDSAIGDLLLGTSTPVYATFPLSGQDYKSIDNVYGDDAFSLVAELVKDVNEWNLLPQVAKLHHYINMHRVRDARAAIIRAMEYNAKNSAVYETRHGKFQYYGKYKLLNVHFHIWEIQSGKITEVEDQNADVSTLKSILTPPGTTENLAFGKEPSLLGLHYLRRE
jgi:ABC-type branched-subunit amino acid transport system substrate-binding protein